MRLENTTILGIETSCDDTAAAVLKQGVLLSNITANQEVHQNFGGVVPELASRAHLQNIIPVVQEAIKQAGIRKSEIDAVAVTQGPGLMGSLLVGYSFAKSLSLSLGIPLINVHHMRAHILAHFIKKSPDDHGQPKFPFLCLTVSGGHTQIVKVNSPYEMEILGETKDDAAGEAFDKAAKIMGLPYPGGPLIDKYAKDGNPSAFTFGKPRVEGLDFSFSGLKTSFLYTLRKEVEKDPDFVEKNKKDISASIQSSIVDILMEKLEKASQEHGIQEIAIAGGVSANGGLREALRSRKESLGWTIHIPPMAYCTDNAAMIAMSGHFQFLKQDFSNLNAVAQARKPFTK